MKSKARASRWASYHLFFPLLGEPPVPLKCSKRGVSSQIRRKKKVNYCGHRKKIFYDARKENLFFLLGRRKMRNFTTPFASEIIATPRVCDLPQEITATFQRKKSCWRQPLFLSLIKTCANPFSLFSHCAGLFLKWPAVLTNLATLLISQKEAGDEKVIN